MHTNVKKTKRLKEIDDRDDGLSDTFNSLVSKDQISEDLEEFIKIFSEITKLT